MSHQICTDCIKSPPTVAEIRAFICELSQLAAAAVDSTPDVLQRVQSVYANPIKDALLGADGQTLRLRRIVEYLLVKLSTKYTPAVLDVHLNMAHLTAKIKSRELSAPQALDKVDELLHVWLVKNVSDLGRVESESALKLTILLSSLFKRKYLHGDGDSEELSSLADRVVEKTIRFVSSLVMNILSHATSTSTTQPTTMARLASKCFKLTQRCVDHVGARESLVQMKSNAVALIDSLFAHLTSTYLNQLGKGCLADEQMAQFMRAKAIIVSVQLRISRDKLSDADETDEYHTMDETLLAAYSSLGDLIYSACDDDSAIDFNLSCLNYQLSLAVRDTHDTQRKEEDESRVSFRQLFAQSSGALNYKRLFYRLAASISFDAQLVVDWLISNETNCLVYLVKFLKLLLNELQNDTALVKQNEDCLVRVVRLLEELCAKIKRIKTHFPYNCEPLIKLLDRLLAYKIV